MSSHTDFDPSYRGVDHTWAFGAERAAVRRIHEALANGDRQAAEAAYADAHAFAHMANQAALTIYPFPEDTSDLEACAQVEEQRMAYWCRHLGIELTRDRWGRPSNEVEDTIHRWWWRTVAPGSAGEFRIPEPYRPEDYDGD